MAIEYVPIEDEMQRSYLSYAMSVIIGRALPDARDGLKPVHRRILYAMWGLGLLHNRPFKKSATIIGEVLGKYHPHGDMAVYDALVRMAQDFSLRYPLVQGQGNFGSVDGDAPAAYRYTEARLSEIAEEMLRDIEKDTVPFMPNFDGKLQEPQVLPAKIPNLLINGASGIAVGMATNIPPHNLGEVIDALVALIDNPELTIEDLTHYIKGPDFPTGGEIIGTSGILQAYKTGKGKIILRGKTEIVTDKRKNYIYIREIPYQINKALLIERIAELVKNKVIEGIIDIRDESDREGIRVAIELRKDIEPEIVLNKLYMHTPLQTTYGIILLALRNNVPHLYTLKEILTDFLEHRHDVVKRRTQHDLKKAEDRLHIVEGLRIALDHIDEVVSIIKGAPDIATAEKTLGERFNLTPKQTHAILEMRLARLTHLEREKLDNELQQLQLEITRYREILASRANIMQEVKKELLDIRKKYADARRTKITEASHEFNIEDLIPKRYEFVTVTRRGYIKRTPLDEYKEQQRGGKGARGIELTVEDRTITGTVAFSLGRLLIFTDKGKAYAINTYEIPLTSKGGRGKPIAQLLNIGKEENIIAIFPYPKDGYQLLLVTQRGLVKRVPIEAFNNITRSGIIGIRVQPDDTLCAVVPFKEGDDLLIVTTHGKVVRFDSSELRNLSRYAHGVRGIRLREGDSVKLGLVSHSEDGYLLLLTQHGYGKLTPVKDYRKMHRGGQGIIGIKGEVGGGELVYPGDHIFVLTERGYIIRMDITQLTIQGRATRGTRVIRLNEDDKVIKVVALHNSGDTRIH